jgi:hypothetical protein
MPQDNDKLDIVEREFRAMLAKMTGGLAPQTTARHSGTGGCISRNRRKNRPNCSRPR